MFTELASLVSAAPFLYHAPRGDRHPVMVMPGFGASDSSTTVLRGFLTTLGYQVSPWELGRNLGPMMENLSESLVTRLESVFNEADGAKVSLVGWSLGGVYARLLAQLHPDKVRSVITLGSPFGGSPRSTRIYPLVERVTGKPIEQSPTHHLRMMAGEPLKNVPSTAIFSKTDAVVPWQIATQAPSHNAENIEVYASHLGLGFNPAVLFATADRLAQPEDDWKAFKRRGWKTAVYGPANLQPNSANQANYSSANNPGR